MRTFSNIVKNCVWLCQAFLPWMQMHIAMYIPSYCQHRYLLRLLRRNRNTHYGTANAFSKIKSTKSFTENVPVGDYETFGPSICSIENGNDAVLTQENPFLLHPTTGSTSAAKLIPFTRQLKNEFARGVLAWLFDTFIRSPSMLAGSHFWVISPAGEHRSGIGPVPIRFLEDVKYFPFPSSCVFSSLQAVPPVIANLSAVLPYKYCTLLFLLYRHDLTFISIWHPTYLTLLLELIHPYGDRLCDDITNGAISIPLDEDMRDAITRFLVPSPARGQQLKSVLSTGDGIPFDAIWPRLKVISCWCDGTAEPYSRQLKNLFPKVMIQPKGLMATEGCISIPFGARTLRPLAITSHFLEFIPVSADETEPVQINRLEIGRRYSVLLSTGGGLYRYQLHDIIEITGFYHRTPTIVFIAKEKNISDICGEKLHEGFITDLVSKVLADAGINPVFALFAPETFENSRYYALFLKESGFLDAQKVEQCRTLVEHGLLQQLHYRHCRRINQLAPFRIVEIPSHVDPTTVYFSRLHSEGQNLATIKPRIFSSKCNWSKYFIS